MKDFSTKDLAVMCHALQIALLEYVMNDPNMSRMGDMAGLLSNASGLLARAQSAGLVAAPGEPLDLSYLNVPGVFGA